MNPLKQLFDIFIAPLVFKLFIAWMDRMGSDPQFIAKAKEAAEKHDKAQTEQEHLDASKAIHDLLRS